MIPLINYTILTDALHALKEAIFVTVNPSDLLSTK